MSCHSALAAGHQLARHSGEKATLELIKAGGSLRTTLHDPQRTLRNWGVNHTDLLVGGLITREGIETGRPGVGRVIRNPV